MKGRERILFVVVLVIVVGVLVASAFESAPTPKRLGLTTQRVGFGASGTSNVGWLIPANTMISTSYRSTQALSSFVVATLNVFPYHVQFGTTLYLGLYVNGQLGSTQEYSLGSDYRTPATIIGSANNGVANFSSSLVGYTVSQFPLSQSLPKGTTITVTVLVSNPIWAQVDSASMAHSYETVSVAPTGLPSTIQTNTGSIASHTLSVELETGE